MSESGPEKGVVVPNGNIPPPGVAQIDDDHEDPAKKRARIRSIYIVLVSIFVYTIGFSIVLTGVFLYMEQLLPNTEQSSLYEQFGLVVALNPLGQLVFSPIFGFVVNKMGSVRLICIVSNLLFVLGNALYAMLSVFSEDNRLWMLLAARGLTGIASANIAAMRTYVSTATYKHERTKYMSMVGSFQAMGLLFGPAIQAAVTPLQCSEKREQEHYLDIDMYTAAGWIAALMGLLSAILFLPCIFHEFDVAKKERGAAGASDTLKNLKKPDIKTAFIVIFSFFVYQLNFTVMESLATPISLDQFGWTESDSLVYLGITLTCGGVIVIFSYASVGPLSKRFDERKLLIFVGILPLLTSRLLCLPLIGLPVAAVRDDNDTRLAASTDAAFFRSLTSKMEGGSPIVFDNVECTTEETGPPLCQHTWCQSIPAITTYQFFSGSFLAFIGYPYCIAISQATLSKMVGPRPQGNWMGIITSAGALARITGPLFLTWVYDSFGTYATFCSVSGMMFSVLLLTIICYKRLVPLQLPITQSAATARIEQNQRQETTRV